MACKLGHIIHDISNQTSYVKSNIGPGYVWINNVILKCELFTWISLMIFWGYLQMSCTLRCQRLGVITQHWSVINPGSGGNQYNDKNINAWSYFMQNGFLFLYARLKNGRIMLWQCPSVCPSVRPSVRVFRTFFQHALRYQFETWYMHLVGGTTCRVWVSSQLGHFDLVYSQM